MLVNIKDVVDFYKQHPECIGNLTVAGRFGYKKIEYADITAYNSEIIRIDTDNGHLEGSPDHKILISNNTWVPLHNLANGDLICSSTGLVKIINTSKLPTREDLYDLQVKEVHEFYANNIVSHNSTMLDGLSFVLFGKPHRTINKPQLVNSINGKNLVVEVVFSTGPSEYKIIRGIKPGIFEIWCNGKMINQESHVRDYQKLLETNILKLNHKSFHQIVVLGSGNFIPFMQLAAQHRREVIEDLLDIGVFSKMNLLLKENQAKLKENIKDTEHQLVLIKDKITLQNKHIDNLKSISVSASAKYDDEIDDLRKQIVELNIVNDTLLEDYHQNYPSIKSRIDKNNKTKATLCSYELQIKDNITRVNSDSTFYEINKECPTCSQLIDDELRDLKISECTHKKNKLSEGYAQLKVSITDTSTTLSELEILLSALLKNQNTVRSNQILIANFEKRISDLTAIKGTDAAHIDISAATSDLVLFRDQRDTIADLKSTQLEERTYNDAISELLKDSGIKTKIIRQYLPVMNKLINQYLQILDFFISFELDENFSETIRSRHRDDFSYGSFSEGEKSRISLALLFAWRNIAKMKNSSNTNLLILDEVFDGSVDGEGTENLMRILNSLDPEVRIFVISHKTEMSDSRFDRKITVTKPGNFSSYDITYGDS